MEQATFIGRVEACQFLARFQNAMGGVEPDKIWASKAQIDHWGKGHEKPPTLLGTEIEERAGPFRVVFDAEKGRMWERESPQEIDTLTALLIRRMSPVTNDDERSLVDKLDEILSARAAEAFDIELKRMKGAAQK